MNSDQEITNRFFIRLLRWICPEQLYEEIEGDLIQRFNRDRRVYGEPGATRRLAWNAIRFLRPGIVLRNKFSVDLYKSFMLTSYFKTTYRHLGRNKLNFSFKLGGLTVALFSLLIIFTYLTYQFSFDRFHTDYENIYRINSSRNENGNQVGYATVPPAIGPALQQEFPEIASVARVGIANRIVIRYAEKLFRFTGFAEADSSVFQVLTVDFLSGDKHALDRPGSVVLTKTVANQIFGDEYPIGKTITSPDHNNKSLTVTAVINDYPANSHLRINALHNFGALQPVDLNSWQITWDGSVNLYAKLKPGSNPSELASKSKTLLNKNLVKMEDGSEKNFSLYFQAIADIYLDEPLKMEFTKKGNALYVYLFSLLGFFLLSIAIINYTNLSIADFTSRMREIGVRKILGARKRQLAFQITFESIIFSTTALFLAFLLLYTLFPSIASRLEPNLSFGMVTHWPVLVLIAFSMLSIVLFTAVYPAVQIARQQPANSLKSVSGTGTNMTANNVLLTVQYVISIICICATVIIGKQLYFVQHHDLGYDRAHVISLVMPDDYPGEKVSVLKNELGRIAGVESVSYSYYLMPIATYFKDWYQVEQKGSLEPMLLNEMFVDHDYFETMGIQLLAGRNFDPNYPSDRELSFIINETCAKALGFENPVGKRIQAGHSNDSSRSEGTIIGVVKDFNSLSLHKNIEPVVLRLQYDSWPGNSLNLKVSGSPEKILPVITSAYERLMPGFLADARVLNDVFDKQYEQEQKAFISLQVGSIAVVLISALGIFSLSLFMSIRRMKEFGIRKVLGASTREISLLHTGYFLKAALVANAIALPVAYLLMKQWLSSFSYQTPVTLILLALIAAGSLALVIISAAYASWKAGAMNPVDVIKNQ